MYKIYIYGKITLIIITCYFPPQEQERKSIHFRVSQSLG